ncbi:MAG: DUF2007 domain-containing protein [Ardenticatenales bacterium]|nr:DUF2007 domain-containing protein [Ardenticatenales bacterium]
MTSELEVVYTANTPMEAEVIRGLLESNGITVLLHGEAASHIYGLTMGQLGGIQVLVRDEEAEAARELLQEEK